MKQQNQTTEQLAEVARTSDILKTPFYPIAEYLNRNNFKRLQLVPDELIVYSDIANHLKNFEAVGGTLYLTSKRLIFISHRFNIQNHSLYINLEDITPEGKSPGFGIDGSRLLITRANGKKEKFVLRKVEKWLEVLDLGS